MSDDNHHHGRNEIIIIKRHKADHDGAHGGAWKIAFADFMTAMMAFFLVMWLVNASNAETKASVASYFNPIKLSDETPASKGVKKPADKAKGEETEQQSETKQEKPEKGAASASGEDMTTATGDKTNYSEADLFENPYAVLAEIAQEVGQQANVSAKGEGGASLSGPSTGADGGEAYRDPFDPDFWSKQVQASANGPQVENTSLPEVASLSAKPIETVKETMPAETSAKSTDKKQDKTQDSPKQAKALKEDAEKLRETIETAIAGVSGKLAEGLVVTPTEGGMLVTLSDQTDMPMFDVGSAVPHKEMVLAMEKIGKILAERKGSVIIRGHTDGRPFKGTSGDNWSLSMSRAHSAYFMLLRGGLEEQRVKQVSGFADRRLQLPNDPMNNANRRIEILIGDS